MIPQSVFFEVAEMCDEVLMDLLSLPSERFYAAELVALNAIASGLYSKDQAALDWLFDLRRLTKVNIEGTVVWRRGEPHCYRREMSIPFTAVRIR